MLKDIIAAGGKGYLIPAVLFFLLLYGARGLFSLHGRRSQQRKEFLELWDSARSQDDLWLEVAVGHLFGTYLPAHIIRLAMAQPDKSQALRDLSELWPLFAFNPDSHTVSWINRRYRTQELRRLGSYAILAAYVGCAFGAVLAAFIASESGPATFSAWIYSVCTVVFGLGALTCLAREDAAKVAATVGGDWLKRINRSAQTSGTDAIDRPTPLQANTVPTCPRTS